MRCTLLILLLAAPSFSQPPGGFVNEGIINAPVAAVWNVWTTSEGYKLLEVALAEVDLRIGGLIRSRNSAAGVLGDDETIKNRILADEESMTMRKFFEAGNASTIATLQKHFRR